MSAACETMSDGLSLDERENELTWITGPFLNGSKLIAQKCPQKPDLQGCQWIVFLGDPLSNIALFTQPVKHDTFGSVPPGLTDAPIWI